MITPVVLYKIACGLIRNLAQKKTLTREHYQISNQTICLVFSNDAYIPILTRALTHLATAAVPSPDLTIYIADHDAVGTPLSLLSGYESSIQSRGEILALSNDDIITHYNHHDGALNLIHLREGVAFYWIRSLQHLPWWVAGSPLQRIIGCFMRERHAIELTHAAAVGYPDGGVLLAGKSGSGKSTTTLTCLEAGLSYVSEDYCLIEGTNSPIIHSLYHSSKLEPKTLQRFPHLSSYAINTQRQPHEKALMFQGEINPDRILKKMPLKAIVVLQVAEQTKLSRCRPLEAALALSVSTLCQLAATYRPTLTYYATLLKIIPSYKLTLGHDNEPIVNAIQDLLTEAKL